MRSLGGLLVFLGVGSFIINLIGLEFILLAWVDSWGPTIGWVIRGAMIALGALLWEGAPMRSDSAASGPGLPRPAGLRLAAS